MVVCVCPFSLRLLNTEWSMEEQKSLKTVISSLPHITTFSNFDCFREASYLIKIAADLLE